MLYAMNKWKRMILICLWPYAMRHTNNVTNATPRMGEEISPLEKFLGMKVMPKLQHFHAFGCPTYILDNMLQSGQGAPKWRQRSRLGVYLGLSPNHTWSVALVLNPRMGHVSPQFHVKFDDFFETVQEKPTDLDTPEPQWKYLSGFVVQKGQTKSECWIAFWPHGEVWLQQTQPHQLQMGQPNSQLSSRICTFLQLTTTMKISQQCNLYRLLRQRPSCLHCSQYNLQRRLARPAVDRLFTTPLAMIKV